MGEHIIWRDMNETRGHRHERTGAAGEERSFKIMLELKNIKKSFDGKTILNDISWMCRTERSFLY